MAGSSNYQQIEAQRTAMDQKVVDALEKLSAALVDTGRAAVGGGAGIGGGVGAGVAGRAASGGGGGGGDAGGSSWLTGGGFGGGKAGSALTSLLNAGGLGAIAGGPVGIASAGVGLVAGQLEHERRQANSVREAGTNAYVAGATHGSSFAERAEGFAKDRQNQENISYNMNDGVLATAAHYGGMVLDPLIKASGGTTNQEYLDKFNQFTKGNLAANATHKHDAEEADLDAESRTKKVFAGLARAGGFNGDNPNQAANLRAFDRVYEMNLGFAKNAAAAEQVQRLEMARISNTANGVHVSLRHGGGG